MTPEQIEQQEALAVEGRRKHGRWSKSDMLLASIVDAIQYNSYYFISANTPKGKKVDAPTRVPRPGVEDKSKPKGLTEIQREFMERLRQNRGAA